MRQLLSLAVAIGLLAFGIGCSPSASTPKKASGTPGGKTGPTGGPTPSSNPAVTKGGTVTIKEIKFVEVKAGEEVEGTVVIERDNADGDVEVVFEADKESGFTVDPPTVKLADKETTAKTKVKATKEAKDGKVKVTLKAKEGVKVPADGTSMDVKIKK